MIGQLYLFSLWWLLGFDPSNSALVFLKETYPHKYMKNRNRHDCTMGFHSYDESDICQKNGFTAESNKFLPIIDCY